MHLQVPSEITLAELKAKGTSFSAGMYRQIVIPTPQRVPLRSLLDPAKPYDRGEDPGSLYYLRESTHHLIRTRALQAHSMLIYPRGDSIAPINPRAFVDLKLRNHDILLSKDSNVGEVAMVDGDRWSRHMISGGLVRLNPKIDRYYLFAFLKNPLFKEQLDAVTARGATIKHAKELWLDCLVPLPLPAQKDKVVQYVSVLMQAVIEKEQQIRRRHEEMLSEIDGELAKNTTGTPFSYSFPTLDDVRKTTRLDTGLYGEGYRAFQHRVETYKHGGTTLGTLGVKSRRGANLAVSVIGKSVISSTPVSGWYELIRPVNLSEYGTMERHEWLGTKKNLSLINQGEIVLGCEGFEKGRSIVLVEAPSRCVSNFHGTVLYWPGAPLESVIFIRCFLAFLREAGVLDWVGVGGSGGHMSPEYFEYLPIPKFPKGKQKSIAAKYHNPAPPPSGKPTLATFLEWHRKWNKSLGIWELERERVNLMSTLAAVQELIIAGKSVKLPV